MKYTEAFSVSFLWLKNLEFLSHYKCHFPNLKIPGSIAAWMMAHFSACAPDSALHFGCIHLILCAAVPSDFSIYSFTFLKVKRPSPRESQLQGPIPFILNFLTFIPICVTLYFMCHWPVSHSQKGRSNVVFPWYVIQSQLQYSVYGRCFTHAQWVCEEDISATWEIFSIELSCPLKNSFSLLTPKITFENKQ